MHEFLEELLPKMPNFLHGKETSQLESFHSLANIYAPKGKNFSLKSFIARQQLSVLHWNAVKQEDFQLSFCDMIIRRFLQKLKG
jgi:hypothetical protein